MSESLIKTKSTYTTHPKSIVVKRQREIRKKIQAQWKMPRESSSWCVCVCVCVRACACVCECPRAHTPAKLLQLCPTLCYPMDCSPPGSSVHGILQARILEWVAMTSFRGSSRTKDRTHISLTLLHWQAGSLPVVLPGKSELV